MARVTPSHPVRTSAWHLADAPNYPPKVRRGRLRRDPGAGRGDRPAADGPDGGVPCDPQEAQVRLAARAKARADAPARDGRVVRPALPAYVRGRDARRADQADEPGQPGGRVGAAQAHAPPLRLAQGLCRRPLPRDAQRRRAVRGVRRRAQERAAAAQRGRRGVPQAAGARGARAPDPRRLQGRQAAAGGREQKRRCCR